MTKHASEAQIIKILEVFIYYITVLFFILNFVIHRKCA